MTADNPAIDHYVWVGYYINDKWDDPSDRILATDKEAAQKLITREAEVENSGWEKNEQVDYPLYQLHDTDYHIVTAVRKPVFGSENEAGAATERSRGE